MGRRKGPTPSLLPAPVEVVERIGVDQVRRIMLDSCWRKKAYATQAHARADAARLTATQVRPLIAYRCPFHSLHVEKHFHVGHPPHAGHVEAIALAIRWCTAHPDEVPQPHPSVSDPG